METLAKTSTTDMKPKALDTKHGISPTTGQPLKGPASTAIVKMPGDTGKGQQVDLKKAIDSVKPGNTVTYHGTQVQITEANQNTDQVNGMKNFMQKIEKGSTRAEALSDTRTKYPKFQLAPKKPTPGKSSSVGSSAGTRSRS